MGFDQQAKQPDSVSNVASVKPRREHGASLDDGNPSVVYDHARAGQGAKPASEDSIDEVELAVPAVEHDEPGVQIDPSRTPTTADVLRGRRPDLSGAGDAALFESTRLTVSKLFESLQSSLTEVKGTLARTTPPPESPFAVKLIAWAVERVASMLLGEVGRLASEQLFKDPPAESAEPTSNPHVVPTSSLSPRERRNAGKQRSREVRRALAAQKSAPELPDAFEQERHTRTNAIKRKAVDAAGGLGAMGVGKLGDKIATPAPTTAPGPGESNVRAAPGESLFEEYFVRQHRALLAKEVNSVTTLHLLQVSAQRRGIKDLNERLNALTSSFELAGWYKAKVTMEWLNFATRAALGPREEGQTTDLPGANLVDGIASRGPAARQTWSADGAFLEIELEVPALVDGTKGVGLRGARIPSSPRAVAVLKSAEQHADAHGAALTLATIPIYRRVHLKMGPSKLSSAPAFVITPDGRIEADLSNPALTAIGAGHPVRLGERTHVVGGAVHDGGDDDPEALGRRLLDASAAMHGAQLVAGMLRGHKTGEIK